MDVVQTAPLDAGAATFEAAIVLAIEPGWHVYWRNPGDSGMAPSVRVKAPAGWKVGDVRWPAPRRFRSDHETTFGYERAVALFVPLEAPKDFSGEATLEVECRWMACRSICLTGAATRPLKVVAAPAPRVGDDLRGVVEASRAALPRRAAAGDASLEVAPDGREGVLRVTVDGAMASAARAAGRSIEFIPDDTPGVSYAACATHATAHAVELHVPLTIEPGNALGRPLRAAGLVLALGPDGSSSAGQGDAIEIDLPVSAATVRPAGGG